MTTVSILIVTYNSEDVIRECLQGLSQSDDRLSTEIIVADNASSDHTVSVIRQEFPSVRLIADGSNKGFGAGNNQAFAASSGQYVALVNPDVVMDIQAVADLISYLENHPDVGIVGPRIVNGSGEVEKSANPPFTVRQWAVYFLGRRRFPSRFYADYDHYKNQMTQTTTPTETAWLTGACLVMPRTVYDQLNGFDEAFFLFAEDVDLCDRAWEAGWRVVYLPNVLVKHYGSTSVSRVPLVWTKHNRLSLLIYFRKRGRWGAMLVLKFIIATELFTKAIKRSLQSFLTQDATVHADAKTQWAVLWDILKYC